MMHLYDYQSPVNNITIALICGNLRVMCDATDGRTRRAVLTRYFVVYNANVPCLVHVI